MPTVSRALRTMLRIAMCFLKFLTQKQNSRIILNDQEILLLLTNYVVVSTPGTVVRSGRLNPFVYIINVMIRPKYSVSQGIP